jgi:hypothetical protein
MPQAAGMIGKYQSVSVQLTGRQKKIRLTFT